MSFHLTLDARVQAQLDRIETLLKEVNERTKNMSTQTNALDNEIAQLQTAVTNETTVEQSAITLINGIPNLIAAAVAKAQAAGATPEELSALTQLQTQISQSSASLASAVTANTPAAVPAGSAS